MVRRCRRSKERLPYGLGEEEVVVFRFHSEVLEYRIGPESLHEILLRMSIYILIPRSCHIPNCLLDRA